MKKAARHLGRLFVCLASSQRTGPHNPNVGFWPKAVDVSFELRLTSPRQHPAWPRTRGTAVAPYHLAIHNHRLDPGRRLNRALERRRVAHGLRIEQRDIRRHAVPDEPAAVESERLRGKSRHLVDRRLEGKEAHVARVVPEHARKRAPKARMRRTSASSIAK